MLSFLTLAKIQKFYEIMANLPSGYLSGCLIFSKVVLPLFFRCFGWYERLLMLENDGARVLGKILIRLVFGEYGSISLQNETFIKLFRISSLSLKFLTLSSQCVFLLLCRSHT